MKKYYLVGGAVTFIVIFNLGYVFHEILMGGFFKETIGAISREEYIIPVIALAFMIYTAIQAYFLHVFYTFASAQYRWSLTKSALVIGTLVGFLWDGLQGGMIEVATFRMPAVVFFVDSSYHTIEGTLAAWILSLFYRKFVLK